MKMVAKVNILIVFEVPTRSSKSTVSKGENIFVIVAAFIRRLSVSLVNCNPNSCKINLAIII